MKHLKEIVLELEFSQRKMDYSTPTGTPIPDTSHAVSVSLPTWQANVGYEEGDPKIVSAMNGGYPRFVFHPLIQELFLYLLEKFAVENESLICLNSRKSARDCKLFITKRMNVKPRLVEFMIPRGKNPTTTTIHIVIFPESVASIAKEYWQHTGAGISSRFAEYCLNALDIWYVGKIIPEPLTGRRGSSKSQKQCINQKINDRNHHEETCLFVEERFGRNMDSSLVEKARLDLKTRIAGVLGERQDLIQARGKNTIGPEHVFLFSCGMSSIYYSHQISTELKPGLKTVQFGFPYIDTLKIQQKWGTGCVFYGKGGEEDLRKLELLLEKEKIAALYCEFPSNPLLISPPIKKLWDLSIKHDFYLIVDETIGNFVNVSLISYCDMLVSSLTKVFSGYSNVMGGSLVINPSSPKATKLLEHINKTYVDSVWRQDLLVLESNSRKFKSRIETINRNAETLCERLRSHAKVSNIYYPKYIAAEEYLQFASDKSNPGFGGLFSIVLKNAQDAQKFYDLLPIHKGPSLGTNFTLACPYTLLAHYTELDWAAEFGVSPHLIRVSVGTEPIEWLISSFVGCLDKL